MREIKFRARFKDGSGWFFWEARSALYTDQTETRAEDIDLKSISQFTGLHDKNGMEIYEGDILDFTDANGIKGRPTVVEYDFKKLAKLADRIPLWDRVEVIGNIYETD